MEAFEFAEAIGSLAVLVSGDVVGHIHIPPGVVVVNAVPGVAGGWAIIGCSINNVARDILATAEGGEEIGEIVAYAFAGM